MISRVSGAVLAISCVSVLLGGCGLLTPPPDDTKGVRKWLVVPVFYATNRTLNAEQKSPDYSEVPNGKGHLFGVKNIAVPIPINSPLEPDTLTRMKWQEIQEDPSTKDGAPPVDGDTCPIKDSPLDRDQVVQQFSSYMKNSHSKEIVIFVHGCCATFDTSMKRAARSVRICKCQSFSTIGFHRKAFQDISPMKPWRNNLMMTSGCSSIIRKK